MNRFSLISFFFLLKGSGIYASEWWEIKAFFFPLIFFPPTLNLLTGVYLYRLCCLFSVLNHSVPNPKPHEVTGKTSVVSFYL